MEILTSADVLVGITAYATELRAASAETRKRAREYAEADRDYKTANAAAYTLSEGTSVAAKRAEADGKTIDLRFDVKMAEALWKSAVEAERSARTIVNAYQSYVSFAKTEAELARG